MSSFYILFDFSHNGNFTKYLFLKQGNPLPDIGIFQKVFVLMFLYRKKLATTHDFRLIRGLRTLFSMVFRTVEIHAPWQQHHQPSVLRFKPLLIKSS